MGKKKEKKTKQKKQPKQVKPIEQPKPIVPVVPVVITPLLTQGEANLLPSSIPVMNEELSNSIQPSIDEIERFVIYLNKCFHFNMPDNIIVNIQETSKNTKGFFMPSAHLKHYENTDKALHYICVSSNYLKDTPYETVAHEFAHFVNEVKKIKDVSGFQYHNKHFKEVAETLLLKVEKGKRGYAYTYVTDEFKKMLEDFKPNPNAFRIYQHQKGVTKSPNRNLLFMCECGVRVRTARNGDKPFQAICQYCKSEFALQEN